VEIDDILLGAIIKKSLLYGLGTLYAKKHCK